MKTLVLNDLVKLKYPVKEEEILVYKVVNINEELNWVIIECLNSEVNMNYPKQISLFDIVKLYQAG